MKCLIIYQCYLTFLDDDTMIEILKNFTIWITVFIPFHYYFIPFHSVVFEVGIMATKAKTARKSRATRSRTAKKSTTTSKSVKKSTKRSQTAKKSQKTKSSISTFSEESIIQIILSISLLASEEQMLKSWDCHQIISTSEKFDMIVSNH